MQEQLYRRGADGIMERAVPEARGKAAAFDRWLAQGGKPFKVSGKFKDGPMKGLTYDQAKQKFEGMWAGSPDALKEKYAGRAKTDLAPSEQIQGISPAIPQRTPASTGRTSGPSVSMKATNAAPTSAKPPVSAIPGDAPAPRAMTNLPTDERMHAQGKTNAGGVAPNKVPNAAVGMTPTTPAPKINSLTGLPMGYRPGDAVAPQFKAAADASVSRQIAADPRLQPGGGAMVSGPPSQPVTGSVMKPQIAGITPVPRGPASQPAPTGSALDNPNSAFSKEAYARTAAAEAQGVKRQEELSKAVNVDDPKKFFTGRTLPLDQLVKRQKLQGIGTPARQ